jgi:rubrerythrin
MAVAGNTRKGSTNRGAPAAPLNMENPDPGRVVPYGAVPAEDERLEPDIDLPVWLCTSCGYQWQRPHAPQQCPNCALADCFVKQVQ